MTIVSDKINKAIDKGMVTVNKKEPARKYLGASLLGRACGRQIQYMWKNISPDKGRHLDGKILRIFRLGDKYEDAAIEWFEKAGFKLKTEDKDGKQIGFTAVDDKVKGHIDGILKDGPTDIKYPRIWECKSMNNKKYSYFQQCGVQSSHSQYYSQVQIYMHMLDIKKNPAILTGVNKENGDMHHEEIIYNEQHAQSLIEKAKEIVKKTEEHKYMPRFTTNKLHFECKYCSWQDRCWRTIE